MKTFLLLELPIAGIARNITVPADSNVTTPVTEFVPHIVEGYGHVVKLLR